MKLLCECGHPNHQHFGGARACHAWYTAKVHEDGSETLTRCVCQRFVPKLAQQRSDLA